MVLHANVFYCTVLHSIAQYCIISHGISCYCMALYFVTFYCIVFCVIARCYMLLHWYCIILYCILWYCMVLLCIAWHQSIIYFWGKSPLYIVVQSHNFTMYELFFCVTVWYGDGISVPSRQGSPKSLRNLISGTICWGNFCFGNLGNTGKHSINDNNTMSINILLHDIG